MNVTLNPTGPNSMKQGSLSSENTVFVTTSRDAIEVDEKIDLADIGTPSADVAETTISAGREESSHLQATSV